MLSFLILASAEAPAASEGTNQIVTIANQFGVMPHMLIAQIVNFVLVAWIFWALVIKPIQGKLDERTQVIEDGVKRSHESEQILKDARNQSEQILKEAYQNSQGILEDTKKQAEEFANTSRATTKKETQEMLEKARKEMIAQQEHFLAQSKTRLAAMVVELAQKSLGEDLTEDQKQRYNQRAAQNFQ